MWGRAVIKWVIFLFFGANGTANTAIPSESSGRGMVGLHRSLQHALQAQVIFMIGMGVVPLCFEEGTSWQTLGLKGSEQVTIRGLHGELKPRQRMMAEIVAADGALKRVPLICRIDTYDELEYFKNGGILQYVLRHLAA